MTEFQAAELIAETQAIQFLLIACGCTLALIHGFISGNQR